MVPRVAGVAGNPSHIFLQLPLLALNADIILLGSTVFRLQIKAIPGWLRVKLAHVYELIDLPLDGGGLLDPCAVSRILALRFASPAHDLSSVEIVVFAHVVVVVLAPVLKLPISSSLRLSLLGIKHGVDTSTSKRIKPIHSILLRHTKRLLKGSAQIMFAVARLRLLMAFRLLLCLLIDVLLFLNILDLQFLDKFLG